MANPDSPFQAVVEDMDDTRTLYSAATTILSHITKQTITDVCENIYNTIRHQVDSKGPKISSGSLTGLIKAFALKLGADGSNDLFRRVMLFVHKHNRCVILQVVYLVNIPHEADLRQLVKS